jgi:hypothetical protein
MKIPETQHSFHIPNYQPITVNRLLSTDPRRRSKLKQGDYELIAYFGQDVPKARGKRRVSLQIELGPRKKGPDPEAIWKVINDGLSKCGLLLDDRKETVELGPVTYIRAAKSGVTITLEDLEPISQ